MGPLGADVEALDQLAASMRTASRRLTGIALDLDRRSRTASWHGVDADRFRRDWDLRHRPLLFVLGERCDHLGRSLEVQSRRQRRASAAASGGTAPTAAPRARPGTVAGRPEHRHLGRPPLPEPPLTEQRFQGGVDIKVGLVTASLSGDLWIQQLADGRVRVSVAERGGLGLVAGVGAASEFSIGDHRPVTTPTSGAKAEVRAQLGGVERRSWVVDRQEVDGLVAKIAAAESMALASPDAAVDDPRRPTVIGGSDTRTVARAAGGLVDAVSEFVLGVDPGLDDRAEALVTIPAPDRAEALAQVELAAAVGVGLFGQAAPAGQLTTTGTLRAGRAVGAGSRSTVIEYDGGASAALSAALAGKLGIGLPTHSDAHTAVRLELAEQQDGGPDHLLIKLTRTHGSQLDETLVRIDLREADADDLSGTLRTFVSTLAVGDLTGASLSLAQIPMGSLADGADVSRSTAEISGTTVRGGGSVAAALSLGFSARGQAIHLDRR